MNRRNFLQTALAAAVASATRLPAATLASDPISLTLNQRFTYRCGEECFEINTRHINIQSMDELGHHRSPHYYRTVILRWSDDHPTLRHLSFESCTFDPESPQQIRMAKESLAESVRWSLICAADPHFKDRFILENGRYPKFVANPEWIQKPEPRIVRDDSLVVPPIQPEYQPYV